MESSRQNREIKPKHLSFARLNFHHNSGQSIAGPTGDSNARAESLGSGSCCSFFSGIGSIASAAQGGVAYMAHISGFLAGLVLSFLFRGSSGTEATG